MRVVGVKELKARLSEYLRLVKTGEVVLVTDRNEVVAELRPARRGGVMLEDLEVALDGLADSGEVTRAVAGLEGWRWAPSGLGLAGGTAARLLDGERDEGGHG